MTDEHTKGLNGERKEARRVRIVIRQLARRIVDDYLADCGGAAAGFTFDEAEVKLAKAIESAIHGHRGRARIGGASPR